MTCLVRNGMATIHEFSSSQVGWVNGWNMSLDYRQSGNVKLDIFKRTSESKNAVHIINKVEAQEATTIEQLMDSLF